MTLNRHWGHYLGDEDWKPLEVVVRHLVDIASKGGNFLLNVGPTGEGVIPAGSAGRLREVGAWLERNGEAVYGTTGSPLPAPGWGRLTRKTGSEDARLYLHVFAWPADGRLRVPVPAEDVLGASLLDGGQGVEWSRGEAGAVELALPPAAPDPASTTIVLRLRREVRAAAP
ncbi:MAG TPA: alpha-L-fucosidase [Opitutaceae bacterium]|nr:alpha-L-fucosidase [Opitutaceae bacterium]